MFLHMAFVVFGMNVGIVNCHEMLMVSEVEESLRELALSLVMNTDPKATMLCVPRYTVTVLALQLAGQ